MTKLSPSKKGDIAELDACSWLLQQGYEVFRNVSSDGPIDLIAIKDGQAIYIDVKTPNMRDDKIHIPIRTDRQIELDIQFLLTTPTGWQWA